MLIIDCLQTQSISTFEIFCQSDACFLSLQKSHGHYINVNNVFHTMKRWKKLQESVKLIIINDEVILSSMTQYSLERKIYPTELRPSIV